MNKIVARESWMGNRQAIYFLVDKAARSFTLIPGYYETDGEFRMLKPEFTDHKIVSFHELLAKFVS